MTVKQMIESRAEELGYTLGVYDSALERLTKKSIKDVLEALSEEYTDVDVKIGRKLHVVEIATVEGEKDFNVLTQAEYIECYGTERWDD